MNKILITISVVWAIFIMAYWSSRPSDHNYNTDLFIGQLFAWFLLYHIIGGIICLIFILSTEN